MRVHQKSVMATLPKRPHRQLVQEEDVRWDGDDEPRGEVEHRDAPRAEQIIAFDVRQICTTLNK